MILRLQGSPYKLIDVHKEVKWDSFRKNWDSKANFILYEKPLFKKLIVFAKLF